MSANDKDEDPEPVIHGQLQHPEVGQITSLLRAVVAVGRASEQARQGMGEVRRELEDEIYRELEKELTAFAYSRMTERDRVSLDACSVVGEVLLDLSRDTAKSWRNRGEFKAWACRKIESYLKDNAKKRKAKKRGGDLSRASESALIGLLDGTKKPSEEAELAELCEWLREQLLELEGTHPDLALVVYLSVFCGLPFARIGPLLGVDPITASRRMQKATAVLVRNLNRPS